MLNFEGIGIPLLTIEKNEKTEKEKKEKKVIVSIGEGARHSVETIELPSDQHFQQAINIETERSILYIAGQSGSGKSHYTRCYVRQYHTQYPKRDIYLFSALDCDTTLDACKYIRRIKLSEELIELNAVDFKDSLVIFDDTDAVTSKPIKRLVVGILNTILQTGRHHNTSCVYTSHSVTNGQETRLILSECHSITIFPSGMGNRSLRYLLDMYLGLDRNQVKYIKKCKSRWVTIAKCYPMVVFSERNAIICKNII